MKAEALVKLQERRPEGLFSAHLWRLGLVLALYGENSLEVHVDAIDEGDRVLLIDDLLATGGTMLAATSLVKQLGGIVEDAGFVVSLPDLLGESRLCDAGIRCFSLCSYEGE